MSLADAWEHNAADWIAWARAPDHDDVFWEGTWPALLEILPDSTGLTLDLGCGEGRAGRQLLAAGRRVLGIERSPTLARAAATGSPSLPVAQADASRLPLADSCIDLAMASMSLLDMDDFAGAIAETARVLRPGGVFCFAIVHPFDSACDSGAASGAHFAVSLPYLAFRRYEDRFDRDGLRTANRMTGGNTGGGVAVEHAREEGSAATVDRPGSVMGADRAAAAGGPPPR